MYSQTYLCMFREANFSNKTVRFMNAIVLNMPADIQLRINIRNVGLYKFRNECIKYSRALYSALEKYKFFFHRKLAKIKVPLFKLFLR